MRMASGGIEKIGLSLNKDKTPKSGTSASTCAQKTHTAPHIPLKKDVLSTSIVTMCCHRLYIYHTCGHSSFSPAPLILCRHASIPPDLTYSTHCKLIAHPYQSFMFDHLCPTCQHRRDTLMGRIEQNQVVTFDDWRWKVSYELPLHGKDYWTAKMEKMEKEKVEEAAKASQTTSKRKSVRGGVRVSWRRISFGVKRRQKSVKPG
jgi:hypothetical protein